MTKEIKACKCQEGYNGWSNYATWRVKLELWDDSNAWEEMTFQNIASLAIYIKETTEETLENQSTYSDGETGLILSYALAFLDDVNYYEIAKHIAEDYPKLITEKDDE
jgi:hypothetical protein